MSHREGVVQHKERANRRSKHAPRDRSPGNAGRPHDSRQARAAGPRWKTRRSHRVAALSERLAEYGWKPHRVVLAQKSLSPASMYRCVCV